MCSVEVFGIAFITRCVYGCAHVSRDFSVLSSLHMKSNVHGHTNKVVF